MLESSIQESTFQVKTVRGKLEHYIGRVQKQLYANERKLSSRLDELESELEKQVDQQIDRPDNASALNELTSRLDELFSRLDELSSRVDGLGNSSGPAAETALPRDCSDLPAHSPSGVYRLALGLPGIHSQPAVQAFCDLERDGGGWTVIQRRALIKPLLGFNRGWAEYKTGFGQPHGEFWWGLENMFQMTGPTDRQYELRVNLADSKGNRRHAIYGHFRVDNEANGYRLSIGNYTGDAGDSLMYHNDCMFSTPDKDQDMAKRIHCGRKFRTGWWYRACQSANLNGQHRYNRQTKYRRTTWNKWPGVNYYIPEVEMKIRPIKTILSETTAR
ncbi:Angiopoietin-related protein 7 [Amphibalanus amphitrite]|uniref:Angiopoietin-related protein 7 n=1 Tax=Amphibalanus amphitrite TaxID=1232801 RepID=A0A6A4X3Z1_AMPAM|nr:Angiopoietin-related protein 7 [Amphibalanus amphitrite]